ncbi:unnamed protein product [Colias eurytheme]|nr:unnamed protein product [Colias eurytheme]
MLMLKHWHIAYHEGFRLSFVLWYSALGWLAYVYGPFGFACGPSTSTERTDTLIAPQPQQQQVALLERREHQAAHAQLGQRYRPASPTASTPIPASH